MFPANHVSGPDVFFLIVPFAVMMAFAMFGLDARLASPKRRPARKAFCEFQPDGRLQFSDPDGRDLRGAERKSTPPACPPVINMRNTR